MQSHDILEFLEERDLSNKRQPTSILKKLKKILGRVVNC